MDCVACFDYSDHFCLAAWWVLPSFFVAGLLLIAMQPQTEHGRECRFIDASPEDHAGPRLHQRWDSLGVPIREAHTAVRLREADTARFWRPVQAVVLLRNVDPHHAYRIIGARRDFRFRVRRIPIPKQRRVVVKRRIPLGSRDLPLAVRQRIMLATARNRRMEDDRAFGL
jgi:hypothetical protein